MKDIHMIVDEEMDLMAFKIRRKTLLEKNINS